MANKIFLRASDVYEAPEKRLQNDIEITGATITHSNGRIISITFSGGSSSGALTLLSPDGSVWTITVNDQGVLSQSKP